MKTRRVISAVAVLLTMALASTAAAAPVIITQAKANNGGVTPGDAPGFPVTISKPGSYILGGNLTVPNGNTTAIIIAADHVTLDLGGYAILGPVDCSGGYNPCAGKGSGSGIVTGGVRFNLTIRNGTIQGLGTFGIRIEGDSHLIEYVHARSNGWDGIVIANSADLAGSIAQFNTAQRNGNQGIVLSSGIVRHNVADVNGNLGIFLYVGSANNNVARRNAFHGLSLGDTAGFYDNVLVGNGAEPVWGGVSMGRNLCGTVAC